MTTPPAELKPCPWCGSCALLKRFASMVSYIKCANCKAEGPTAHMPEQAIALWNTRT